jgi:esterase/lipase superfamily enzyme
MRREHLSLYSPAIGASGDLIAYGHFGQPVLAFPSEQGRCWDYEDRGMVGAIVPLIEQGRVKLYCIDSYDAGSWFAPDTPIAERARRHGLYEDWIVNQVVPWIDADCAGGASGAITTGCSFGAYHAANLALKRADLFPIALCQSGVYDITGLGHGGGDAVYFNNPMHYVANLHGDHLAWLQGRVRLVLVCGQGQWEDTTGALESTKSFAALLRERGIACEAHLWGHEWPHDWPSWRAQVAHHLGQLC